MTDAELVQAGLGVAAVGVSTVLLAGLLLLFLFVALRTLREFLGLA